jgi:hypothetical protein
VKPLGRGGGAKGRGMCHELRRVTNKMDLCLILL